MSNLRPIVYNILANCNKYGDKQVLVFDKECITYRDLRNGIIAGVSYLQSNDLKLGDYIGLYIDKNKESIFLYYAAQLLGITVAVLNSGLKRDKVDIICKELNITFVCDPQQVLLSCVDDPFISIPYVDIDFVAHVLFTSGSTGQPKVVPITYRNQLQYDRFNKFVGIGTEEVGLITEPLCYAGGMGALHRTLLAGGTAVIPDKFYALQENKWLSKITTLHTASSILKLMLTIGDENLFSKLTVCERIIFGSMAIQPEMFELVRKKAPSVAVCVRYGLTEALLCTFSTIEDNLADIGLPVPGCSVEIMDAAGNILHDGAYGEICVEGDNVIKGYWNTDNTPHYHGNWFRTGDLGYKTEDGHIILSGRIKEMINVGGEKVTPMEVESYLLKIEGIKDAGCVGVKDPRGVLGEVVKAVLVHDEKYEKPKLKEIKLFLLKHLESFKVPVIIVWRDKLPYTDSGKLKRKSLCDL